MPSMRIPYTGPLPLPRVIPSDANELTGAVAALKAFLTAAPRVREESNLRKGGTICLTGAGISVAVR